MAFVFGVSIIIFPKNARKNQTRTAWLPTTTPPRRAKLALQQRLHEETFRGKLWELLVVSKDVGTWKNQVKHDPIWGFPKIGVPQNGLFIYNGKPY